MPRFVRILAVALLAIFAAGTVVHAAGAATMAIKMALAADGAMSMPDCAGCDADGDGDGPACNLVCTAPFVADLRPETTENVPAAVSTAEPTGIYDFVGRSGPPDPYPPRTLT